MNRHAGSKYAFSAGLRSQQGAYVVEMTLALILSMMAAVVYWQDKAEENRATGLKAAAQQATELNNSVQTYASQNYSKILNNQPIAKPAGGTVANIFSPTIQELKELGYLTATFSTTPIYGGGYQITLSKVPSDCTVPNCDVQSLVSFTKPIYKSGTTTPDEAGAGLVVQQIGANGGRTTSSTPTIITGLGAGWSMPSPVAQAGVVAIRGGYISSAFGVFFRTDGTSVMGGNANMGGNDVYNVKDLISSGAITGNSATISGLLTAKTLTAVDDVSAGRDVIAATGKVKGLVVEGGKLQVNDIVTEGTSCVTYPSGTIAKDVNGMILSCQSGRWKTATASSVSKDYICAGHVQMQGLNCLDTLTGSTIYFYNSGKILNPGNNWPSAWANNSEKFFCDNGSNSTIYCAAPASGRFCYKVAITDNWYCSFK